MTRNSRTVFRKTSTKNIGWPVSKGQYICIDPVSKLVMVQTAVEDPGYHDEPWALWSALVEQVG
jgi:hypothetical protein